MIRTILGRIACVAALVGLGVSSAQPVRFAEAAAVSSPKTESPNPGLAVHSVPAVRADDKGRGWGGMIGCSACLIAAGAIVAGGPATIIIAINTPGSAIAALACSATCYEAFQ